MTLGGRRTLRIGTFQDKTILPRLRRQTASGNLLNLELGFSINPFLEEDVWDDDMWNPEDLWDVDMMSGSIYVSSPYCFEHGVRYQRNQEGFIDPVIALQ